MPVTPVFVDTVALAALIFPRDSLHQRAIEVSNDLASTNRPLITTDWVLTEFLGAASDHRLRGAAGGIVERLCQSKVTEIVAASRTGWQAAFDFYKARSDKDWSLVDCSSMIVCREREITDVFTHDHHFTQAGFRILL